MKMMATKLLGKLADNSKKRTNTPRRKKGYGKAIQPMKKPTRKTLAITLSAILTITLATGWIIWRKTITPENAHEQQTQQTDAETKTKPANTLAPSEAANIAIQYEHTLREWGTDPNTNLDQLAAQPAETVLQALKTPNLGTSPLANLSTITPDGNAGPDAPGVFCQNETLATACQLAPTMKDWLNTETWTVGSRWVDEPKAEVNSDGTVKITGSMRSIFLQDTDSYNAGGYYAVTPAWKTYRIEDVLTINDDRKVTKLTCSGDNYWWLNPWLEKWGDNIANNFASDSERIAIPVLGEPDMHLTHYASYVLPAPEGMADSDVEADWHYWNNLNLVGGGQPQGLTTE